MAKILISGIMLFISLGFLIIGGLLIQNNIDILDNSNYQVKEAKFTEKESNGLYSQFKLRVFVTFGELSIDTVKTNLIDWVQITGLNQKAGANKYVEIIINKGVNGQSIHDNLDLSELWIHFYLSDSHVIKWSDNTYSIE